jgi:hypothetical protein
MKKRALRRHHYQRMKRRAVRLFRDIWKEPHLTRDDIMVGIYANTHKPCSCSMCGNPRRHFKKPTRKEIIFLQYAA